MKRLLAIIALMSLTGRTATGAPVWATKDTQSLSGNLYTVVCMGAGPNLNDARDQAISQCNILASKQMGGSTKVKAVTVETETDAAFHQEISNEILVKNLICKPLQEEVEYGPVSTSIFIKCQYDLSRSALQDTGATKSDSKAVRTWSVTLSIVPKCRTILVRGSTPRVVNCETNPVSLVVGTSDTDVVIRADGYIPRTIPVGDLIGGRNTDVFLKAN